MQRVALITGICGMDASYLADFLLEKDYKVYGLKRRSSSNSLGNVEHLADKIEVIESDLLDLSSLERTLRLARPDEFYHLAAQSHVGTSFEQPILTMQVNGIGTLNCLEAIRQSNIYTRFYFAATSEMFGGIEFSEDKPLNEKSMFHPRSPYGCAKLAGFWLTTNYREAHKLHASSGILFNHEGSRRGPNFVTRKITLGIKDIVKQVMRESIIGKK